MQVHCLIVQRDATQYVQVSVWCSLLIYAHSHILLAAHTSVKCVCVLQVP